MKQAITGNHMTLLKKTFAAAIIIATCASPAYASLDVGSATTTIIKPITIHETQPMNFGTIFTPEYGGIAYISTNTNPNANNGVFELSGENGFSYNVSIESEIALFRNDSNNEQALTARLTLANSSGSFVNERSEVQVIGTVFVQYGYRPGSYIGRYWITANY